MNEYIKQLGDDKFLVTTMFVENGKLMEVSFIAEKKFIQTDEKTLIEFYKKALSKVK